MLIIRILIFIIFLYFIIIGDIIFINIELLKISSVQIDLLILLDWISLLFISVVLLISSIVLLYRIEYMIIDQNFNRFIILVLGFVISILMIILRPNIIRILLGWDGLGLVSYCLVIYYQNEVRFNSGIVTVLINRVGDVIILIAVGLILRLGSWNFLYYSKIENLLILFIFIASITKSAQIPFSSWLPIAIAAPTPVSSLVHSSTLVTAGVYLLIRFNYLMEINLWFINFIIIISLLTIFLSGLGANFEFDLKKVIALSTLRQLGVIIFCLSIRLRKYSFFHLLTHAMFKSILFICAGVIIHNIQEWQDIRRLGILIINLPIVIIIFNCASFSLCGIPFLSGFFSKDLILEIYLIRLINKLILLILFISIGLTIIYSMRLIYYITIKLPNNIYFINFSRFNRLILISIIFLYFISVTYGLCLRWLLYSIKNLVYLTFKFKILINIFLFIGCLLGLILSKIYNKNKFLLKLNLYYKFFRILWFIQIMYKFYILNLIKFNNEIIYYVELGWNEYLLGGNFINIIKKIIFIDLFNKNYYILFLFIIYILLLIFIFI